MRHRNCAIRIMRMAFVAALLLPSTSSASMYLRIFKIPGVMELWSTDAAGIYSLTKVMNICAWSGRVGPKMREGDKQTPEGFYLIHKRFVNWGSRSINIGYPNAYERSNGQTGSYIMIHGGCSSDGCIAMGADWPALFETITNELTFRPVPLHIYPFRLEGDNLAMARQLNSRHYAFWSSYLAPIYKYFEDSRQLVEQQ